MYLRTLYDSFSNNVIMSSIIHRVTQDMIPVSLEIYNDQPKISSKKIYIANDKNIYSFLSKAKKLSRATVFVSSNSPFYYNEQNYPDIDMIAVSLPVETILNKLAGTLLEFSSFTADCQNTVINEHSEMQILDLIATKLDCCALLVNEYRKIYLQTNKLKLSSKLAKGAETGHLILPKNLDLEKMNENKTFAVSESSTINLFFRGIQRSEGKDNKILIICGSSKICEEKVRDYIFTAASNIYSLYSLAHNSNVLGSSRLVQLIDYMSVAHQPNASILREMIENLEKPIYRFYTNLLIQKDADSEYSNKEIIDAIQEHFPNCNVALYNGTIVVLYSKNKVFFRTELDTPELYSLMEKFQCRILLNNAISNWMNYYVNLSLATDSLQILSVISSDNPSRRIYHLDEMAAMLTFNTLCDNLKSKGFNDDAFLYFSTPNVVHLAVFEQIHNENLVDVLYEYLINGRNILNTSKALYMHRNTIYKKIKKIKDSIPMDIDDPNNMFTLLFSCMTLKFYKRYLKRPIPATIGEDNTLTSLWPTDYINTSERGI